jgi:hypothetical protein
VWGIAILLILARAGFFRQPLPRSFVNRATWVLAVLLVLGAVPNLLSRSPGERLMWGPVALILALLTCIVARQTAA